MVPIQQPKLLCSTLLGVTRLAWQLRRLASVVGDLRSHHRNSGVRVIVLESRLNVRFQFRSSPKLRCDIPKNGNVLSDCSIPDDSKVRLYFLSVLSEDSTCVNITAIYPTPI